MPATIHPMPLADVLTRTVNSLVGRPVQTKPGKPVLPALRQPVVVATYVEDNGKVAAACICDLAFAAGSGAALVMLPADVAADCVKSGRLADNVAENFQEVVNVAAGLFNSPASPRVKLRDFKVVDKLPDDVAALAKTPVARLDLEITIQGYAPGKLSLLGT